MEAIMGSPVTLGVIVLTGLLSYRAFADQSLLYRLIFNPYQILQRSEYYRLVSSGFVHADWGHLIFNMFSFYFFGRNLETILTYEGYPIFGGYTGYGPLWGSVLFVAFYLSALVASSLPDLLRKKNNAHYNSLGASGAVNAVIFGTVLFGPWQTIYIYFIPIPAIVFAALYLGYSYYASKTGRQQGINHDAHLWGALYGIVLTVVLVPQSLQVFWQSLLSGI